MSVRQMTRVVCALTALVSGCSLPNKIQRQETLAAEAIASQAARRQSFDSSLTSTERRRAAQEVDRPWLAGRSVPLAREVALPVALQANVDTTLMFAGGPSDLPGLAARITRATGIAIRISPEAVLPLKFFLPRLNAPQDVSASLPEKADLATGPQPLARALDAIGARLGIYWRYRDGAIDFYRTDTRVFAVRSLSLAAKADARLGRSGNGGSGGFESGSHTEFAVPAQDTIQAVRARVEPFLSRAGVVAAQAGSDASIVVTDTPDALARVSAFLERENRSLTRRVRLLFEEVTVAAKNGDELGIDWNVVFDSARAVLGWQAEGHAAQEAAGLSARLAGGAFKGSRALVSALSEVGTVVRRNSVPVLTLNRRPVTHAVRTTFSYVDQVRRSDLLQGRGGPYEGANASVSVSQKQETVGSFLTVLPDVQEDGQILLSVAYDNTVAKPLKSITFGQGEQAVSLQQITIDGDGTVTQIALRPGQPMIISGFDRSEDEYRTKRLAEHAPLLAGGMDAVSHARTSTLLIVTAQVEEGA